MLWLFQALFHILWHSQDLTILFQISWHPVTDSNSVTFPLFKYFNFNNLSSLHLKFNNFSHFFAFKFHVSSSFNWPELNLLLHHPPASLKLGQGVLQNGCQLAIEEASKFVRVSRLSHQGEHQALDVGKELRGEDVVDVLLDDRYHLAHHPLDLLIQLLRVDAGVLEGRTHVQVLLWTRWKIQEDTHTQVCRCYFWPDEGCREDGEGGGRGAERRGRHTPRTGGIHA